MKRELSSRLRRHFLATHHRLPLRGAAYSDCATIAPSKASFLKKLHSRI
jgi:hypothetical protein